MHSELVDLGRLYQPLANESLQAGLEITSSIDNLTRPLGDKINSTFQWLRKQKNRETLFCEIPFKVGIPFALGGALLSSATERQIFTEVAVAGFVVGLAVPISWYVTEIGFAVLADEA